MNLFDVVIARKLSGGGGGSSITVEPLSVTENDTYTAPTGKAYSPVTVNVSGGSSDFSTAEVTIINSASDDRVVLIATVQEAFPPFVPDDLIASSVTLAGDETAVVTTPLYKGLGLISKGSTGDTFYGATIATSLAVTSGSATVDDNNDIQVTGDCTITIS